MCSTEDKRNGEQRLAAHKKNCKKGKDKYAGNTTYCLGKTMYSQGFTSRTTTSAARSATSEDKVKAKKIAAAEKPMALKDARAEKPKALSKGMINKIGKQTDLLHLYISEAEEFEARMTKHLPGEKTMRSGSSTRSGLHACRSWWLKAKP